jgi:hypothetical protein
MHHRPEVEIRCANFAAKQREVSCAFQSCINYHDILFTANAWAAMLILCQATSLRQRKLNGCGLSRGVD